MRRRILRTTKILSLTVAMLPACDKVSGHAEPTPSAVASGTAQATSATPPPVPSSQDPKLLQLAGELEVDSREHVLAQMAHYRPLCDDQGYPLVGNLPPKTMGDQKPMLPSDFCAEVRKKPTPR